MITLARQADGVMSALASLRGRGVTFDPAQVGGPPWRVDRHRDVVGHELPGPPVPGGVWEAACDVVRDYDFVPPELLRAAYRPGPLVGRDILLIGRTGPVCVLMGVRVTSLVDESDAAHRTWGWAYRTLEGHLQRGEVRYRVTKDLGSGEVAFAADVAWRPAPELGPALRLAWTLLGRRRQQRFYPRLGECLRERVRERLVTGAPVTSGDLVEVPLGIRRSDRFALVVTHPAGLLHARAV
jgi:uncharacterized protein (UPF0548 family)